MVNVSSEFAGRAKYVEDSLGMAVDLLRRPQVAEALGSKAADLATRIEQDFFVPDVNSGEYTLPKCKRESEAIPVIAVEPNESVTFHRLGMTPGQQERAVPFVQEEFDVSQAEAEARVAYIAESESQYSQRYTFENAALDEPGTFVHVRVFDKKPHQFRYYGRPFIYMAYVPDSGGELPDTVVHETVHVEQILRNPMVRGNRKRNKIDRELDAFGTEHPFNEAVGSIPGLVFPRYDDWQKQRKYVARFYRIRQLGVRRDGTYKSNKMIRVIMGFYPSVK